MPLYFAYGSNMVPAQMARRCPGAHLVGTAMLADYRFAIVRGGHGTVQMRRGARVHGVLWRLSRGHCAALDAYEDVFRGLYRRRACRVASAGRGRDAFTYVAAATAPGRPRAAYIDPIVAAARRFGFPTTYIASLEAISRTA
jgi:gamma-glutamylcyclotransferase (GGCT)/AIG2-like uncharacterized protein YtfP